MERWPENGLPIQDASRRLPLRDLPGEKASCGGETKEFIEYSRRRRNGAAGGCRHATGGELRL